MNKLGDNVLEESLLSGEKVTIEVTQPRELGDGDTLALHDIMIDEDYGISISEKDPELDVSQQAMVNSSGNTLSNRSRTYWQPPMDRYFIDLMLEQVRKGSRIDGVFRKQAWMEMIALFNAKFGFSYDMDVLKNRYKTLRRQYNVIKNLLDLDGFVWDDTRQMVTADDYVWQDYIKVCISFINRLRNFALLSILFRVSMKKVAFYIFYSYGKRMDLVSPL